MFKELLNKLTPAQAQSLSECTKTDEIMYLMEDLKIDISREQAEALLKMLLEKDKELSDEILGLVSGGFSFGYMSQSNAVRYRTCPTCGASNSFSQNYPGGPRTCSSCGFSHDSSPE